MAESHFGHKDKVNSYPGTNRPELTQPRAAEPVEQPTDSYLTPQNTPDEADRISRRAFLGIGEEGDAQRKGAIGAMVVGADIVTHGGVRRLISNLFGSHNSIDTSRMNPQANVGMEIVHVEPDAKVLPEKSLATYYLEGDTSFYPHINFRMEAHLPPENGAKNDINLADDDLLNGTSWRSIKEAGGFMTRNARVYNKGQRIENNPDWFEFDITHKDGHKELAYVSASLIGNDIEYVDSGKYAKIDKNVPPVEGYNVTRPAKFIGRPTP